jgi:hypothetical protein
MDGCLLPAAAVIDYLKWALVTGVPAAAAAA